MAPPRNDTETTPWPAQPARTTPPRNDTATTTCPVCHHPFTPTGRRRYCSDPCRQTAWRRRHQLTPPPPPPPPPGQRRAHTVYTCPECDTRYLGEQWCHDCNRPCRRAGTGGTCPHCDEPVTFHELDPTNIKLTGG